MTCRRTCRLIASVLCSFMFSAGLALAQGDPALEQGLKSFGMYSGGDLDSVSLTTTKLNVHIPIWSYPQRGGKLHLDYSVHIDSPSFTETCHGENCHWWATPGSGGLTNGVMPSLSGTDLYDSHGGYLGTPWTLTAPDGAVHQMGAIPTAPHVPTRELRSLDATGYHGDISDWAHPILYDADGTQYDRINRTVRDLNGNQLTLTGAPGYPETVIDTIGRTIPPIPSYPASGSGDGHFAGCSVGSDKEMDWNVPGQNGPVTLKLCWNTAGNSYDIVLPNLTAYTFKFTSFHFWWGDGDGNATDLMEIDLPTGGKISYTWDWNETFCNNAIYRVVKTRTVYDGHNSYQWKYDWGLYHQPLTVTDPSYNQAVYTVTQPQGPCSATVVATQEYDSHQTLQRTVNTTYSWTNDPGPGRGALSLVPIKVTKIWPSNLQSQKVSSYGTQFTFVDYANKYDGSRGNRATALFTANPASVTESDNGTGAPGATLRQTMTAYAAFPNWVCTGVYCQANLLNLVASTDVTGAAGDNNQGLTGYGYDGLGNLLELDRYLWAGGQWRALASKFDYTSRGMPQDSYDPNNHRTIYSYDSTGLFLASMTDALWHTTQYSYDANTGVLNSVIDPNGQTTSFSYDPMRRPQSTSYPDRGSTRWQYNETSFPFSVTATEKITSSISKVQTAVVDGFGRVTQTQLNSDLEGIDYTDFGYDGLGRLASARNPYRSTGDSTYGTTFYQYDALGRLMQQTQPDGGTILRSYTGNVTTITDEAGKVRKTRSDPLGRLTSAWEDPDSLNYETDYVYDCLDDLVTVTQKGGSGDPSQYRVRSFSYDTLGRLLSATTPEAGLTSYAYDDDNTLVTRKDARNITTTYSSDALYRTTQKQYSNGDPTVKYCYDNYQAPCGVGGTVQNGTGRRTAMADGSGSASWSYDAMGRLTQEVKTIRGVTATTAYLYNLDGSLSELGYPYGDGDRQPVYKVEYGYSPAGRPLSAKVYWYGRLLADFAESATYTPGGALMGLRNPASGATITNSYDKRLQPVTLSATAPLGHIFELDYDFKLGSADNGSVYGVAYPLNPDRSQVFTYDRLNRLLTAGTNSCGHSNSWGDSYAVDGWGNLIQKNISHCTNGEYLQYTADAHNRLGGYTYDAAGNLRCAGSACITFNAENQWTFDTFSGQTYVNDGDGQKVQRTGPSGTFWYFTDQAGRVLEETNRGSWGAHNEDEFLYFGGMRMGYLANFDILRRGSIYYTYNDHLGTPRLITDQTGRPCYSADYYPWGGEQYIFADTCADKQDYKFTGKERDPNTGSHYFGARWFRFTIGRFYSPDWSATPEPVPYAKLDSPQSLNLYSYVGNNPTSRTDRDGHVYDDPGGGSNSGTPVDVTCVDRRCTASPEDVTVTAQAPEAPTIDTPLPLFIESGPSASVSRASDIVNPNLKTPSFTSLPPGFGLNYCGPGSNGKAPSGRVDKICMHHDRCDLNAGVSAGNIFGGLTPGQKKARASCDIGLCIEILANATSYTFKEAKEAFFVGQAFGCFSPLTWPH